MEPSTSLTETLTGSQPVPFAEKPWGKEQYFPEHSTREFGSVLTETTARLCSLPPRPENKQTKEPKSGVSSVESLELSERTGTSQGDPTALNIVLKAQKTNIQLNSVISKAESPCGRTQQTQCLTHRNF
jgi:hypothetical protein